MGFLYAMATSVQLMEKEIGTVGRSRNARSLQYQNRKGLSYHGLFFELYFDEAMHDSETTVAGGVDSWRSGFTGQSAVASLT